MGRLNRVVGIALTLALLPGVAFASDSVRISQVFGGGGEQAYPSYSRDYVEIFNASATDDIDLGGWAIEYGSPSGNWGAAATDIFVFPAGTSLHPCGYFLVAMRAGNARGTYTLPTPDFTGTLSIEAVNGEVALFNAVNPDTPCGSEVGLQDRVGYGTAMCADGARVAALSIRTGAVRRDGGLMASHNNAYDFEVVAAPVPHNSASSAVYACLATPVRRSSWGALKSIYR